MVGCLVLRCTLTWVLNVATFLRTSLRRSRSSRPRRSFTYSVPRPPVSQSFHFTTVRTSDCSYYWTNVVCMCVIALCLVKYSPDAKRHTADVLSTRCVAWIPTTIWPTRALLQHRRADARKGSFMTCVRASTFNQEGA